MTRNGQADPVEMSSELGAAARMRENVGVATAASTLDLSRGHA
jgi:hypothetical protein